MLYLYPIVRYASRDQCKFYIEMNMKLKFRLLMRQFKIEDKNVFTRNCISTSQN